MPQPNRFFMFLCRKWYILRLFVNAYVVQKCLFFEILHLFGLTKNDKNVSVTSKMQMFTKIIA